MNPRRNPLSIKILLSICTIVLLIILLLFPKSSLTGAENGILLWFNVIVPTLLPFIIASNLIINLRLTTVFSKLFYPLLHKIFGVSRQGSYVSVIGLLTGLPVGAKACGDLVKDNLITKSEGQYLLTFCNNASPMFIISFISLTTLNLPSQKYIFLGLIYLSGFLTSFLYRGLHKMQNRPISLYTNRSEDHKLNAMECNTGSLSNRKVRFSMVDQAIMSAFDVITKVGGYIVLFSIFSNVLLSLAPANSPLSLATVGFIEITNGINTIGFSSLELKFKIALLLSLTAFGGLSSVAQTKSVIDESGLSIRTYFVYKLCNAAIAFVLVSFYLHFITL